MVQVQIMPDLAARRGSRVVDIRHDVLLINLEPRYIKPMHLAVFAAFTKMCPFRLWNF